MIVVAAERSEAALCIRRWNANCEVPLGER